MKKELKERLKKLLKLLTDEEKEEFLEAVEDDFGCQWDGEWNRENSIFVHLYKKLKKELKVGEKSN